MVTFRRAPAVSPPKTGAGCYHRGMPQKWEYARITKPTGGPASVSKPDCLSGLVPDEEIMATLNRFGHDGWELVQEATAPDGSSVTYTMKRPVTDAGD